MNPFKQIDMAEATRLTREGRLDEAMALLRGLQPGAGPSTGAPRAKADGSARRAPKEVIDLVPPAQGSDGVWTQPDGRREATAKAAASPGGRDGRGPGRDQPGPSLRAADLEQVLRSSLGNRFAAGSRSAAVGVPPGASFEEHLYTNEAGTRPYKLYVPAAPGGNARPLIVMLHGCTQSPDDFAAGTRMNELAEEFGFLVAYPGQTQSANVSKCWNWFNAADQQRDRGEPSLLAGITRTVLRDHDVDPSRVYIAGLSAGGAAAAVMGAAYPDLYAAVGVHSGLACGAARDMASAFSAMRQGAPAARTSGAPKDGPPTIVFHGDRDTTVHPTNGDHVVAQVGAGQRTEVRDGRSEGGMTFTRTIQFDRADRVLSEQWVLHGGGHAWSGGSASGSYTDPRGPDASREMVRFFLEHGRRGRVG
ncbi:extracellular catalytic domain type 1 short-chain-length polyhydroxyalkanoate depolymerase [Rubellimicrobium arenae]|uniref:extracellular catalytic domain type 1 short-chain-length polyhydroxyalkanoate depolymerase n=1 Tax=Rubellimicrobium arenae TaxID=2817372 RepID=UPI001B30130C|nr:PHB depolymerase family esterase [Rubellimicrobium arenae]